jgi:hypothetical protein
LCGSGYSETTPGSNKSWTLDIQSLPWKDATNGTTPTELEGHTYDGVYTYTITVKDDIGIAARTSTKELTVVVDTTGPVITVSGPVAGTPVGGVNGDTLAIFGTANDALSPTNLLVFYHK